jgi:hypothetical protein
MQDVPPELNVTELTQLSRNAQIAPVDPRTELQRMPLEIVQVDAAGKDLSSRTIQSFATSGSPSLIPVLEVMPQSAGVRGIASAKVVRSSSNAWPAATSRSCGSSCRTGAR